MERAGGSTRGDTRFIDHRLIGDGLREGLVDGLLCGYAAFEGCVPVHGADLAALLTTGALIPIYIACLSLYSDMEIAHLAGDAFYLAVGHYLYVGMLTALHHPRGFDTLGAIEGGEGL